MKRAASPTWLACALAAWACDPGRDARHSPAVPADSVRSQTPTVQSSDTTTSPWQVGPGPSGPITPETSEAELQKRYGGSAVSSVRIQIGEGDTEPGTVLYPNDSLHRAEVLWQDTIARRRPARVILRGDRSQWKMPRGISLGTSLRELERLNGQPFTLAGFGWDYAGVVTDWRSGALDTALAGIKLYLDPGPAQYESAPYSEVLGDRDYSSSLPAMQQLNPRVAQIFIDFEGS